MISLDYQIRNALIELQEWADVSTPEDIEKFYRDGFPYYHSAFSTLDADNFLFITNENPWRAIPVFCYNKDECRLARCLNDVYKIGGLIMRTYNGFVVRHCTGAIDTVQNSNALMIFSLSPVIKVVPRKSVAACDLKDEHQFYVTNNLNDYVIQNSGELRITPNGIEYIEKYSGGWRKRVIATPAQMLGLYGNDFCRKLFNFITKETSDPIERMCQERLKKIFEEDLNE